MYGEQKKETQAVGRDGNSLRAGSCWIMVNEQVTMAYLYLNADVPYKAAKVMDKGLNNDSIDGKSKNWELTGNAWRQAQEMEKAIPAMEISGSQVGFKGELYARLGNILPGRR